MHVKAAWPVARNIYNLQIRVSKYACEVARYCDNKEARRAAFENVASEVINAAGDGTAGAHARRNINA